ncbi:hypothetical protein EYZ11_003271 [Aspergillus tanneri]|uniref:Uncharacterized protein n=1 Tax=Aspergillus tanneri TaxID=1220188 RepID=A0A4S3JNM0_9EURO|nr:hypothetical protein EYZ11_003271 [Aspergillus tanneri]
MFAREKILISKTDGFLEEIESISLVECSDADKLANYGPLPLSEAHHWAWALELPLSRCDAIAACLTFDIELKGQRRNFKVADIRTLNRNTDSTLFRFTKDTNVSVGEDFIGRKINRTYHLRVQSPGLGGMARQIGNINEALADFNIDSEGLAMPSFYEHSRGCRVEKNFQYKLLYIQ